MVSLYERNHSEIPVQLSYDPCIDLLQIWLNHLLRRLVLVQSLMSTAFMSHKMGYVVPERMRNRKTSIRVFYFRPRLKMELANSTKAYISVKRSRL